MSDSKMLTIYALCSLAAAIVFMIAAGGCFRANLRYRGAIDECLDKGVDIPERKSPLYGAAYLNGFIAMARGRRTSFGQGALDLYIRPTLLWIDIRFAVFCAAFAALFWLALLELLPSYHALDVALKFFIGMAILYGLTDVGEDLWLVRLFSKESEVTKFEGAIACGLTQTKLVTIILSVAGGLLFLALNKLFARA
jgi:hypothetical protein